MLFVLYRGSHRVVTVIQSIAPGMAQEHQSYLPGRVLLQGILNGDEILEGLRHFAAFYRQVPGMKEVSYPMTIAVVSLLKGYENNHIQTYNFNILLKKPHDLMSSSVEAFAEIFSQKYFRRKIQIKFSVILLLNLM